MTRWTAAPWRPELLSGRRGWNKLEKSPLRLRDLEEERIDRHLHRRHAVRAEELLGPKVGVPLIGHTLREVGQVREVAGREDAVEVLPHRHDVNVVADVGKEP